MVGRRGAGSEGTNSSEYPFHLIPFPHNTLGDGHAAHLPWLQAAPDPLTSVTWRSWVELNPRTAAQLGVGEGDLVAVETPAGRAELPVYVNPAAPPDVLGIPLGQGHIGYGRWAAGRGANPLDLLSPLVDEATGALAYAATRARLMPLGRRANLPKLEGTVPAYQIPDAEVLKVTGES
jgi:anaerobic selenocysteine-containing dehydrogenase